MTDNQFVLIVNLEQDITPSNLGDALKNALHEMGADDHLHTHFEEYWGDHSEVTLQLVDTYAAEPSGPKTLGTVTLLPMTTEAEIEHVMSRLEDMSEEEDE